MERKRRSDREKRGTMMNEAELKEIRDKLYDLREQESESYSEIDKLEAEEERIVAENLLNSGILKTVAWELRCTFNDRNFHIVAIALEAVNAKGYFKVGAYEPKEIFDAFGDDCYHGRIYLNGKGDDQVIIVGDDGDFFLTFESLTDVVKFVKSQSLHVMYPGLDDDINRLERELKQLKKIRDSVAKVAR
jgi:cell division protein FtsB